LVLEVKTDQLKGETTKSVQVVSNDPDMPQLRLRLKFTVKTILQILPKDRVFINIKRGDAWAQEFKVTSTDGKPFRITSVNTSSKYMLANFKPIEGKPDEQMAYSVKVTASPDIPIGRFTGTVEIKTDLLEGHVEAIHIFGKIAGPISYYPERIGFNPNPRIAEGQVSRTIHFYKSEGKGFEIRAVETNHKDIIWKIIPVEQGRSYVLVLIWKGKDNKQQVNGELVVSTDNNDMPIITVPYVVFPAGRKQ
jgi:hypothetical protein